MTEMTASEMAAKVGGQLDGEGSAVLRGMATLESARADQASFLANAKYEKQMQTTAAGAVLVAADYSGPGKCLIRCKDPYFAFREAMIAFHGFRKHPFTGIDARANISPAAVVDPSACIGAFVTVERDCRIGPGTVIYPGTYVGVGSTIGADCILYPNVTLYDGSVLHDRVTIHAGSSIGHDGFGYSTHKGEDGVVRHEKIPQVGYVQIEDDVEIGACTCVDRAKFGVTRIGAGTKMDNLVQVAHNVQVGKHCLMAAGVRVGGSVRLGNYVVLGGGASLRDNITLGDGVQASALAGVGSDIPAGQAIAGTPAGPAGDMLRQWHASTKLPELLKRVRELENRLNATESAKND